MGFEFGEMDVREQNPWAYDATNDLQKAGGLYVAAAGLVTQHPGTWAGIAASGLTDNVNVLTVPAGKTGYITDFFAHATGQFTVELDIASVGQYKMYTPAAGGEAKMPLEVPFKVAAGSLIGYIAQNTDSSPHNISIYLCVVVL